MGEFAQNLLKLTEFPFSYSFIGLLALIFGHDTMLENLTFANIGPLLILMGFVATTLSICDPVGALVRRAILGTFSSPLLSITKRKVEPEVLLDMRIFGKRIGEQFIIPYIFSTRSTPDDFKSYFPNEQLQNWVSDLQEWKHGVVYEHVKGSKDIEAIRSLDLEDIWYLFKGLRRKSVTTKWITAEIDRIIALTYFAIVISVFLVAILVLPDLLHEFAQVFADTDVVRLIIAIFSVAALVAVIYMFGLRIIGLMNKARTVFNYLTLLEAVKVEGEKFKGTFHEIEHYLNDNDWILADYWILRTQIEYIEVFLNKFKEYKNQP